MDVINEIIRQSAKVRCQTGLKATYCSCIPQLWLPCCPCFFPDEKQPPSEYNIWLLIAIMANVKLYSFLSIDRGIPKITLP